MTTDYDLMEIQKLMADSDNALEICAQCGERIEGKEYSQTDRMTICLSCFMYYEVAKIIKDEVMKIKIYNTVIGYFFGSFGYKVNPVVIRYVKKLRCAKSKLGHYIRMEMKYYK